MTTSPGAFLRRRADVEVSSPPAEAGAAGGAAAPAIRGAELDAVVDAVVERIEERVIDELERRGRRHDWGVF